LTVDVRFTERHWTVDLRLGASLQSLGLARVIVIDHADRRCTCVLTEKLFMLETVETQTSQALVLVSQTPQQALMSTEVPSLDQVQREAIVDLLLLGMYADRHVAVAEQEFLAAAIATLGWDEFYSPEIYFQRVVPTVREVLGNADRTCGFLQNISARLDQVDVMKFAIEKFSTLIALDGVTEASEAVLFDAVMEIFFAAA
jgi:hypothetical protein